VAGNWRAAIAFGMIGVMLAALVWLLVKDGDSDPEAVPTTQLTVAPTTSTTGPTTSTSVAETTTTSIDPDARVAEVARILEDLEIAWYDAVYRKDESVLPDIVATRLFYDAAVDAMEALEADFVAAPADETVNVELLDVLLDRGDCLVVHFNLDLAGTLGPDASEVPGVQILWPQEGGGYRLATLWTNPSDLWQDDCDLMDRTEIP
jgi:hypothetical protein